VTERGNFSSEVIYRHQGIVSVYLEALAAHPKEAIFTTLFGDASVWMTIDPFSFYLLWT
jgi:hypothetical protein